MKLDANETIKDININGNLKNKIKLILLKKFDLISVETLDLYKYLNKHWKIDVKYIPNGFYDYGKKEIIKYEQKENIICTVGRIGTKEKATEILLEAFKLASIKLKNWKLKIIGPIEEEFKKYIHNFFNVNPELKEKIIFTGPIYDRNLLKKEYEKAKIFCLTSRWEGFALVYVEAMKSGCFIISSDIVPARDIIRNGFGCLFPVDDVKKLSECLIETCNDEEKLKCNTLEIQKFAYKNFYWVDICNKINEFIKS